MKRIFTFLLLSVLSVAAYGFNGNFPETNWEGTKSFVENKGQFYVRHPFGNGNRVLYGYDGSFTRIFFKKDGVTFNFTRKTHSAEKEAERHGEHFKDADEFAREEKKEHAAILELDEVSYYWEGANPNAEVVVDGKVSSYYSYSFFAAGMEKNENYISGYSKITYKNLYPGIDVEYTFHPVDGIKYAIIVHPGGDLSQVKMTYSDRVTIDDNGNVCVKTKFGNITDHAPVTFYQDNQQEIVPSHFVKSGKSISFATDTYDHARTLVIDPWTQTPSLPNSNKVWETETNAAGDVYVYGGDTYIKLLKYNSAGTLQWTYTSPWDSANYWIGGFIVQPVTGDAYMTSGSNGEIRKITNAGALAWNNNPNSLTSYEYWSLAFNCDLTQLVVGGTRVAFGFPTPTIRGVIIKINLSTGAQISTNVVGYGSTTNIPPNVQEVSSICYAPNGNYYFLTLDTLGCFNPTTNSIVYKVGTSYGFDYYIPGYGFGTKQPISAIRANGTAVYTMNGATVEKRSLTTGAVLANASIPSGSSTTTFFGTKVNNNGGIDIDASGNVYVGTTNGVVKYDANLNQLSTAATTFAVYDVDVNTGGEVAACGWSGGSGKIQTLNMSAGAQMTYSCVTSTLSATSTQTNINCFGQCTGSATVTPSGGSGTYTYSWAPSGGTNATASALCAGTYTCTVNDGSSTTTAIVTITQPTALAGSASATQTGCTAATGSATASVTGGTGAYTYAWSPSGGNAATASNLAAGNYSCTITDANGCSVVVTATVTTAGGPSLGVQSSSDATCFGSSNGSVTVSATGNGPFTYSWSPSGGNGATASNLAAGTYTCTVTDANGCTQTQAAILTEPTQISTSTSSVAASCGNNDGSATVTASGGTGSYTYSWSPSGGNAATATNIGAGNYVVTITDANSCAVTASVTVTNNGGPTTSLQSSADVSCYNGTNGTATVNASGNGPFTYSWAPSGGNAASASNLAAGSYTVTVTDQGGCTSAQTVTITQPSQITGTVSSNPATCGNSNGTATATYSGGTGAYTYAWSPSGGNSATESNLIAGNYTVTITDANGCSVTGSVTVTNTGGPTLSVQSSTDVSCFGGTNGTAMINATGIGPFTYSWSPSGGTSATANGLGAGSYTCTVTDINGCISSQSVTITQPATALQVTGTSTPEACGNANGIATVTASGGTGPYTYHWTNNNATTASITNMTAGSYTCAVTDANGCVQVATVVVGGSGSATANAGTSVTILQGDSTTLNGSGSGTFNWSPSTGLSCTNCQNPTASPTVTTIYTLTVTDSLGCSATDTVTVFVDITCGDVFVPNAFSPNGDNQNDILYVRGNCIQYLQFEVYNRWGEKVFYTTNPAIGWDGNWRDKPCEAAVFSYVLRATLLDGTEVEQQGSIHLVK